jgi:hypothetical protein
MTDGFQAYPKWITTPAGARKIVQDAEEEAAEMAAPAPIPQPEPPVVPVSQSEIKNALVPSRADLVTVAEAKGIKVDGRWSDARLAEEIQKTAA